MLSSVENPHINIKYMDLHTKTTKYSRKIVDN